MYVSVGMLVSKAGKSFAACMLEVLARVGVLPGPFEGKQSKPEQQLVCFDRICRMPGAHLAQVAAPRVQPRLPPRSPCTTLLCGHRPHLRPHSKQRYSREHSEQLLLLASPSTSPRLPPIQMYDSEKKIKFLHLFSGMPKLLPSSLLYILKILICTCVFELSCVK